MTRVATLRPLGVADAAWLTAVHAAAFPGEGWSAAEFETMLAQPGFCGLAVGPGRPRGFLLATIAADQCDVVTIAVESGARRRGLASALMSGLLDLAWLHGVAQVHLEVAEDNVAAAGLYRKLGFVELGRRHSYYARSGGGRSDAIRLARATNSNDRFAG